MTKELPMTNDQCRTEFRHAPGHCSFGLRHYLVISHYGLVIFMALFLAAVTATAEEPKFSEYQVKAAFLVNFPKYVDWPADAFADPKSPIVLAVLGETKVTEEIKKVIGARTVNGREIILKQLNAGDPAVRDGVCHILFISAAEQKRSPDVLAKFKDASVLTVGESGDFLEHGGIINLARRDQSIALEVNLTAANQARIKISSKLLNVASVVKGKAK